MNSIDMIRLLPVYALRLVAGLSLLALLAACSEVDEGDGEDRSTVPLPVDTLLNFYCEDVGVGEEKCILDDPENPYARVIVREPAVDIDGDCGGGGGGVTVADPIDKFGLFQLSPSFKSDFYLWGTAQANSQRGENQYYTAVALHNLYAVTGEERIRVQALKAYKAALDNHFEEVTFFGPFGTDACGAEIFTPVKVSQLILQNVYGSARDDYPQTFVPLYDTEAEANGTFGIWGYTIIDYIVADLNGDGDDEIYGELSRNF